MVRVSAGYRVGGERMLAMLRVRVLLLESARLLTPTSMMKKLPTLLMLQEGVQAVRLPTAWLELTFSKFSVQYLLRLTFRLIEAASQIKGVRVRVRLLVVDTLPGSKV